MKILETLRELHARQSAATGEQNAPIAGFNADQLQQLELACGHPLPPELRELLQSPGVFDFAPEVYFEDLGYFCLTPPETLIADAENLRSAAEEDGWELPPCCSLSLVNNEFMAYDLEHQALIAINGDDGEVTEVEFDLQTLLTRYAELWARELDG